MEGEGAPGSGGPIFVQPILAAMLTRLKLTSVLLSATFVFASCANEEPAQPPTQALKSAQSKKPATAPKPKQEKGTVQAGGSETIYGLAPKNTVFWLEVKSFEALTAAFEDTVGDSLQGMGGPSDPESALALLQLMGLPTNKLQMDQPMALALSLELGAKEPNFTAILPMADPQNTAAKLLETHKELKVTARGRFVAISNSPSYRPDITLASSLQEVRRGGLLGVQVQTARLVDRFEMELDQGLEAMLAQGQQGAGSNQARQAGVLTAVETLSALSKGLKDMSFRMDLADGELTLEAAATLRTGSRLTEFGSDDTSGLRDMLRQVNAASDELLLATARKEAIRFLGDPLVAMYGKHAVATETQGMDREFEQLMSMVVADSVDLAVTGKLAEYQTDVALFLNGMDSSLWVTAAERFVESKFMGLEELTLMQPRKGRDEDSRFAQYDLVAQARSQTAKELEHVLGSPRVRLRFLGHGDETMITVGEGAHFQNRRDGQKGPLPTNLTWALDQVQGSNPAFVAHVHAEHGYLDDLATRLLLGEDAPTGASKTTTDTTWVTSYAAFGSTEWRMGTRMDLKALSQQMEKATQMQSAAFTTAR